MKILFMGTPDFADQSLKALYKAGFNVAAVFTQPDKPVGRGMKLVEPPVKITAQQHGTPVYQPVKLRESTTLELLREIAPDIIVVVAYGRILPKEILDFPKYGCINIHGSLLPKYRGAAPIQWAVINGERETGVTSIYIDESLDSGDIIDKRITKIFPHETAGQLFDRLAVMGADLLCDTIKAIESGKASRIPQKHEEATFAPPLTKAMCDIDWNCTGNEILNKIYGLNPWPVAATEVAGIRFKVYDAECIEKSCEQEPGTVVSADKNGILISCKDCLVRLTDIQAAGGRRMKASDYLRGHPLKL